MRIESVSSQMMDHSSFSSFLGFFFHFDGSTSMTTTTVAVRLEWNKTWSHHPPPPPLQHRAHSVSGGLCGILTFETSHSKDVVFHHRRHNSLADPFQSIKVRVKRLRKNEVRWNLCRLVFFSCFSDRLDPLKNWQLSITQLFWEEWDYGTPNNTWRTQQTRIYAILY